MLQYCTGRIEVPSYLTQKSTSIAINSNLYIPPRVLKPSGFQISLHLLGNEAEVCPTVYRSKFNELLSQYDGYIRTFTDGSNERL